MNQEEKIYSAPESELDASNSGETNVEPVSAGLRFANLIIDYLAYLGFSIFVGVAIALLFGEMGIQALEGIPDMLLGLPIYLAYYIGLEASTSRTLGKLITGTKVVNTDGLKPSFGQIVGRSFCRLIPFEAFSFFMKDGVGWHDSIPKTLVIKSR